MLVVCAEATATPKAAASATIVHDALQGIVFRVSPQSTTNHYPPTTNHQPPTTNHEPLTVCLGIRPRAGDAGHVRLDQTPDRRHYHHVRREDIGDDHEEIRVEIGKAPHE